MLNSHTNAVFLYYKFQYFFRLLSSREFFLLFSIFAKMWNDGISVKKVLLLSALFKEDVLCINVRKQTGRLLDYFFYTLI